MSTPLDAARIATINQYDAEKRFQYLLTEVVAQEEIWILTDDDGCVMLNTEDEDCVPVWPHKEFAEAWATGEWAECTPKHISLSKWHRKWTPGLEEDDLAIVVFPNNKEDGLVVSPDDLDHAIQQKVRKKG
ncbi:MAG: DUF2750 domain-containing protein [Algicola sp.]|nr:DUF2750 domain-containing protein [Algicola sp.]